MAYLETIQPINEWLENDSSATWIDLSGVKNHLVIEGSDDDTLLSEYIKAAVDLFASSTVRDLDNHYEYYTYPVSKAKALYGFDGLGITSADTLCKKHDDLEDGLTDFTNQTTVDHTFVNHNEKEKSVYINPDLLDTDYLTVKNHIEWNPDDHTQIKGVLYSLVAEFYRNREFTVRDSRINKIMYETFASMRKV